MSMTAIYAPPDPPAAPPWNANISNYTLFEIAYKCPARPSEFAPALPPDVDLVLAIALAKRREDRFGSALDLASALRDASRGGLDPALRARAASLLALAPWGASLRATDNPRASLHSHA